jgi:acetyl esterase/lipase
MTLVKFTMPLSLEPDAEKERFVRMNPQDCIYNGVLRSSAVQLAIVGGTWYPKLFQPGDEQKTVIFHFHGGSFLWGNGRQADCAFLAATILKRIPATALFVQYRLASDPACTFPAAVQDAVTAYKHLLDMNIPASKIVVSGDSAGGNIAIALLQYLSTADGDSLPSPSAALL